MVSGLSGDVFVRIWPDKYAMLSVHDNSSYIYNYILWNKNLPANINNIVYIYISYEEW